MRPAATSTPSRRRLAGIGRDPGTEAFAASRAHWSEEEVVEIIATIAMAGFLARWNGTMLTPLEEEPRTVGERHRAKRGWRAGKHAAGDPAPAARS